MDLSTNDLIAVGLDAVDAEAPPPAAELRARVLQTAPPKSVAELPPLAAFITTAAEVGRLLDELTSDEWAAPTAVQGSLVRDLVAHLVGVERYVHGQLGRGPVLDAPRRDDHYPTARTAAADLADASTTELAGAWWREVMRSVAICAELGADLPVSFHHLSGSLRGLLIVRTFELWTHAEDIRRATGRPPNRLDADRLTIMSSELIQLLPHGMALADTARPGRSARMHLTGPGGGVFDVALAPDEVAGPPDVTITTEVLDLCRLAANRVTITGLAVAVDGDRSLVAPILVGAGAFALD